MGFLSPLGENQNWRKRERERRKKERKERGRERREREREKRNEDPSSVFALRPVCVNLSPVGFEFCSRWKNGPSIVSKKEDHTVWSSVLRLFVFVILASFSVKQITGQTTRFNLSLSLSLYSFSLNSIIFTHSALQLIPSLLKVE